MKDFNSFKSQSKKEGGQKSKSTSPYELFARLANNYEGKSSEELMQAIIKQAEEGRRNGTLSDRDIDNFASTVSPMLNDKQRKTLNAVVNRIKKI